MTLSNKERDIDNSFNFADSLWRLGYADNPSPLLLKDILDNRLKIRRSLIDKGLQIEAIEANEDLVHLALTKQTHRLTDRGAVITTSLGESNVVEYVNGLPVSLTSQERTTALWPRLRESRIIALRAAFQQHSQDLPTLQIKKDKTKEGMEYSRRRGSEQTAADYITLALQSPLLTEDKIARIVRKINMRVGKHLLKHTQDEARETVLNQYMPHDISPDDLVAELHETSQLSSPAVVLADMFQVMTTPSDRLVSTFYIDQYDPIVLLGNDVKPPKPDK